MTPVTLSLLALLGGQLKTYSPLNTSDLEALAIQLKRHVAMVNVTVHKSEKQPLLDSERSAYAAVVGEDLVVTLPFILDRAKTITIKGPSGQVRGSPILVDVLRRVALIRTHTPVSKAGLSPVGIAPKIETGEDCFALVSIEPQAGVVHSSVTHTGEELGLQGHPRTGLKLTAAMPVFDAQARLMGYARAVAWDKDQAMLVPWSKVEAARSAEKKR